MEHSRKLTLAVLPADAARTGLIAGGRFAIVVRVRVCEAISVQFKLYKGKVVPMYRTDDCAKTTQPKPIPIGSQGAEMKDSRLSA